MTTKTTKCPKCDGRGKIQAFNHVANGDCFACNATGQVSYNVEQCKTKMGEDLVKKAEYILAADENSFSGLSYTRLFKAREFAHLYSMNAEARLVYGDTVYHKWFEVGEPHFQAAQSKRLAEYNSK